MWWCGAVSAALHTSYSLGAYADTWSLESSHWRETPAKLAINASNSYLGYLMVQSLVQPGGTADSEIPVQLVEEFIDVAGPDEWDVNLLRTHLCLLSQARDGYLPPRWIVENIRRRATGTEEDLEPLFALESEGKYIGHHEYLQAGGQISEDPLEALRESRVLTESLAIGVRTARSIRPQHLRPTLEVILGLRPKA